MDPPWSGGGVLPTLVLVVLLGAAIGFLGGLLGKGGSALATPFLVALGVPPMVALAAPLPATVPGTLLAADRYRREGLVDRDVLRWSLLAGLPATVVGAVATRWIGGHDLVLVTDAVIAVLGLRMLVHPASVEGDAPPVHDHRRVHSHLLRELQSGPLRALVVRERERERHLHHAVARGVAVRAHDVLALLARAHRVAPSSSRSVAGLR